MEQETYGTDVNLSYAFCDLDLKKSKDSDAKLQIKFGRLQPIEYTHTKKFRVYYNFKCDCGGIVNREYATVKAADKRGTTVSCGCYVKEKITDWNTKVGEVNNKLKLISYIGRVQSNPTFTYQCECGNIGKTSYQNFLRTTSCGCIDKGYKIGDIVTNFKILDIRGVKSNVRCLECETTQWLRTATILRKKSNKCTCLTGYLQKDKADPAYKKYRVWLSAVRRRGQITDISFENYKILITSDCSYCGGKVEGDKYNGIDRMDSSIGYEMSNSVPCCYSCNIMKSDLEVSEFKKHILKIVNYLKLEE